MEISLSNVVEVINLERLKTIKSLEASQDLLKNQPKYDKPKLSKKHKVLLIGAVIGLAAAFYGAFIKNKEFEDKVADKIKERQDSGRGTGASVITEVLAEMGEEDGMYGGIKSIGLSAIKTGTLGAVLGIAGSSILLPSDSKSKFISLELNDLPDDPDLTLKEAERYINYIRSERSKLMDTGSKADVENFINKLIRKPSIFVQIK